MKYIIFLFLSSLLLLSCKEQITENESNNDLIENLKYYPISVGDFWVYDISHSGFTSGPYNYLVKKEVLFTLQSTNKYYFVKEYPILSDSSILSELTPYSRESYERVDSTSGVVKRRGSNSTESEWMNLMMNQGEKEQGGSGTGFWKIEVKSEVDMQILNFATTVKKYYREDAFQGYTHEFAKGIGLIRYALNGEYDRYNLVLKGAKIGDIVIGDTSTAN